ncbi:MAG TPA: hypothetical protein PLP45_14090, partial [Syntrophales bacterium]|nr:hypothetical protein [Syntrophales bacterium]
MDVLADSTDLAPPSGVDAWEAAWVPWDWTVPEMVPAIMAKACPPNRTSMPVITVASMMPEVLMR